MKEYQLIIDNLINNDDGVGIKEAKLNKFYERSWKLYSAKLCKE